jgi:septal ring factor EnvC (AmiA/AmiB activator)
MGNIADEVSDLEDELHECNKEIARLSHDLKETKVERDDAYVELSDLRKYVEWVEANYLEAKATYEALEKLKE